SPFGAPLPNVILSPIGVPSRHGNVVLNQRIPPLCPLAIASFAIATGGESRSSHSFKNRPVRRGMRKTSKYPFDTKARFAEYQSSGGASITTWPPIGPDSGSE